MDPALISLMWLPSPQMARLSRILELQVFQFPTVLLRGLPEKLVLMRAKVTQGRMASLAEGSTTGEFPSGMVTVGRGCGGKKKTVCVFTKNKGVSSACYPTRADKINGICEDQGYRVC